VLATVRPPFADGSFLVADGADIARDAEAVVAAQPWKPVLYAPADASHEEFQPVYLYRLRFTPATRRTQLTLIQLPAFSVAEGTPTLLDAKLSPDGDRLAVAIGEPGGRAEEVRVYPLADGGAARSWRVTSRIASDVWGTSLSWSGNDHVLAVGLAFGTVQLIDATAPGTGSERIILGVRDNYECDQPVLLTSDGTKFACGAGADYVSYEADASGPRRAAFAEYSTVTGDLTTLLGVQRSVGSGPLGTPQLLWVSPRGTILVGQPPRGTASVLAGGRYEPLPWDPYQVRVGNGQTVIPAFGH
jgi:hypothetical protein